MNNSNQLTERLLDFTVRIIKLVNSLPKTNVGRHIAGQILRSGTSPGSNYEEACGAESRADFVHKLGIVLKELKETRFWLKIIFHAQILVPQRVDPLLKEVEELCAIIAKSIVTAKNKK
ncbi:MAG: four helix bundle protein [Nitrospirae bacterium]|nr:four helix bundle protein [Nitrospirota bacterium]